MASTRLPNGIVFLCILLKISTAQSEGTSNLLSRLLGAKTKPLVLLINSHHFKPTSSNLNNLGQNAVIDSSSLSAEASYEQPDDQHAYLLYQLLKTVQEGEELEESVEDKFENTKDVLRQGALRARCAKLTVCIEECPKKKPTCPDKCQKKFDDWGACGEKKEKPKCGPKCGRTMPPRWLLK